MRRRLRLFISYARKNKDKVDKIVAELKLYKSNEVWIDREELSGGADWWNKILGAIEECDCLIAMLTPHSIVSIYCQEEIKYARAMNKPVIPLLLELCKLPDSLERLQYIDGSTNFDLHWVVRQLEIAINDRISEVEDRKGEPPDPIPLRPSLPQAESLSDLIRDAEKAAKQDELYSAVTLYEKVIKADPEGLGREPVILNLYDQLKHYLLISNLMTDKTELETVKVLWRDYVKWYGRDLDPKNLKAILDTSRGDEVIHAASIIKGSLPYPFEWCSVTAGWVTLEAESDYNHPAIEGSKVWLETFEIAKYPVTNSQYAMFIQEDYSDKRWWNYSKEATHWREEHPAVAEHLYSGDDLPRTDVNWYDAMAFCRWLSAKLFPPPQPLAPNWIGRIRLQTEAQWQRAAQGDSGQTYPWGREFDKSLCNFNNSHGPTPVTKYPAGQSPFGVFDMVGNVWEWCLTKLGANEVILDGNFRRSLRGSSFAIDDPNTCTVLFRAGFFPEEMRTDIGFRIVLVDEEYKSAENNVSAI